jgi:hypothetical protein
MIRTPGLKLLLPDEAVVIITRLRGVFNPDEQAIGRTAAFVYPQAKNSRGVRFERSLHRYRLHSSPPLAAKVIHR